MGKVRDFRSETITTIRDNLVDKDPNWDAFFDFFYDVFGGSKELEADLSNFNDYMKRICEINDITAEKLDQIIADVQAVETSYSVQIASDAANFNLIAGRLDILIAEISKPDFETNFDPVVTEAAITLTTPSDTPPDLTALSPELVAKVLPLLPEDEVLAILPTLNKDQLSAVLSTYSVDALVALDTSQFNQDQLIAYQGVVADKIVDVDSTSDDFTKLRGVFYNGEYADYLVSNKGEIDAVKTVVSYEITMLPEDLTRVNEFFSPGGTHAIEIQDIIGIKSLAYAAPEPNRGLFIEYIDQYTLQGPEAGREFFRPPDNDPNTMDNIIAVDVVGDREDPRGAYATFFHEVGHAIDYYAGVANGYSGYFSSSYTDANEMALSNYNIQDVRDRIDAEIDAIYAYDNWFFGIGEFGQDWDDAKRERIREAVANNLVNHDLGISGIDQSEMQDAIALQDRVEANIIDGLNDNAAANTASDIYGGVSENALVDDTCYQHNTTYSDGSTYWIEADGSVKRTTNMESFAEYYSKSMIGEPERSQGLGSFNEYLPKSVTFMENMMGGM